MWTDLLKRPSEFRRGGPVRSVPQESEGVPDLLGRRLSDGLTLRHRVYANSGVVSLSHDRRSEGTTNLPGAALWNLTYSGGSVRRRCWIWTLITGISKIWWTTWEVCPTSGFTAESYLDLIGQRVQDGNPAALVLGPQKLGPLEALVETLSSDSEKTHWNKLTSANRSWVLTGANEC